VRLADCVKLCMKKLLCIFALTSLIILAGCTSKSTKTVVTFASWGSKSEVDILKPILSDFEKQNPTIKVEFMHIPQNYFQKIHLLYASNTAPDVIFINNLNLPVFANANCLDKISADKNIYYPQALSALSYRGNLYAIPRDVSNLVVFYNKDLFDKKGIPYPNKNWTFNDFLKTAQLLTDKNTFGVSFEENSYFFLPYLMSEGGGILSDNLTSQIINSPQSQKGLNFYTDLRKKYHVAPRNDESASATMAQMFLQQQLGMQVSGRWLVPKYRTDAKFRWDVINFPKGDKGSIVQMDASGWAISKSSKHKLEAKKLIDFLASKDSSEKFAKSGLIVPARIDSSNSKAFLDGKAPENAKVFLDVIKTSKPTPVSVDYNEITDKLAKIFEIKFN
jgi:multiple sugar transport system substrate-binding protein